jgi:hypothetical protein
MLRIDIINDGSGTHTTGNYKYDVLVTTSSGQVEHIATGVVKGHPRVNPWYRLAQMVIDHARTKGDIAMATILQGLP